MRFLIIMINIAVMGFQPIVILVLLGMNFEIAMDNFSPWMTGIFGIWAGTVPFYSGFGEIVLIKKKDYLGINSTSFLLINFIIPLSVGFILGDTAWLIFFELSTFHLLVFSTTVILAIIISSLSSHEESLDPLNPIKGRFVFKTFPERSKLVWTIVRMLFYIGLFGFILLLPAFWCELIFFKSIGLTFAFSADGLQWDHLWIAVRYAAAFYDIRIMFNVFNELKLFDLS